MKLKNMILMASLSLTMGLMAQPIFAQRALNKYTAADLGANGESTGINNRGQVVIEVSSLGFIYTNGRLLNLGFGSHGLWLTGANGINDRGQVVGSYVETNPNETSELVSNAFLYPRRPSLQSQCIRRRVLGSHDT